ncbi:alpha/beta hydrolase fold domain-containing protein [Streptomyces sp. NPDC050264]|uniref:alpha/beta hydrolase n=1 Tax=Streptomyces sp. NPDC050264 TaxID=3155038 RepID=UPI00341E2B24
MPTPVSLREDPVPYALDPELAPWAAEVPSMPFDDVPRARALSAELSAGRPPRETSGLVDVRTLNVAGAEGVPEVPVRVYTPTGGDRIKAALVYLHGGGFCLGDLGSADGIGAMLAAETGAVVVCVGYRLAPENPFPDAIDDCWAVLDWLVGHAAELSVHPARIGVGGDSAGGGLAAAVSLFARDRGGPVPAFQYLGMPVLDDRLETASMRAFTDTPGLRRADAVAMWDNYLGAGARGGTDVSVYAAPARASDLSGLPPAYVSACEFDPLRDEALAYATRLLAAGVPTELHVYPGTFHASGIIQDAEISRQMVRDTVAAIRRGLREEARAAYSPGAC